MRADTILSADLGTGRRWIGDALRWWISELQSMVPPRLRSLRRIGVLVRFDPANGQLTGARRIRNKAIALVVPAELALRRSVDFPRIREADLKWLVEAEADRLSPLPSEDGLVAYQVLRGSGKAAPVSLAILPRTIVASALNAAADQGGVVTSLTLEGDRSLDFLPAARRAGLASDRPGRTGLWWGLLGLLFLLNILVLVIRDQDSVGKLEAQVAEEAPAVDAARLLQRRAAGFEKVARSVAAERTRHDVTTDLGVLSEALPSGAWVQRLSYAGPMVRLSGYKRRELDLVVALRSHPRIAEVRVNNGQVVTDIPAGQPFDITLRLRPSL